MIDLFEMLVLLLDVSEKSPNMREEMKKRTFWSDGTMILSKDEAAINALADLLEQLNGDMITGYFDPKEDRESGVVDECTGYYFLDTNG